MPRALPVVPGHRSRRATLRVHRTYRAGPLRRARVPRRTVVWGSMQDYRGCLQAALPEVPGRARRRGGAGRRGRRGRPTRLAGAGAQVLRRQPHGPAGLLNPHGCAALHR
ncbi:uncharacterized protein LOC113236334 [Hyposmocoma kahamanoa]|uniref:uncharacterized protein LOC113236334 n=1 Tax=Hyposmocoma kahamanoa TaxID=1477025 RepID=UPI000E6D69C5|nr:uncharacterized protein LOC113236334 [Hyposmocoma kahamanoa]